MQQQLSDCDTDTGSEKEPDGVTNVEQVAERIESGSEPVHSGSQLMEVSLPSYSNEEAADLDTEGIVILSEESESSTLNVIAKDSGTCLSSSAEPEIAHSSDKGSASDTELSSSPTVHDLSSPRSNTSQGKKDTGDTSQTSETIKSIINSKPYHPNVNIIPSKKKKNQRVRFQQKWFSDYPWLTYDTATGGVLCHTCSTAKTLNLLTLASRSEDAFTIAGFSNWEKATRRFESHTANDAHRHALFVIKAQNNKTVGVQLDQEEEKKQQERRRCLLKIVKRIRYLLRQGLAFRNNPASEGNLYQLLAMDAEDDNELASYLKRDTNFTSWSAQEEFSRDFSHAILRKINKVMKVLYRNLFFSK